MLFDAVDSDHLGLEWEPSHQLQQLGEPISQLKTWLPKIVHVHGKDAVVDKEHICGEREFEGQLAALTYLKKCRGRKQMRD